MMGGEEWPEGQTQIQGEKNKQNTAREMSYYLVQCSAK
jgi:hypothetical protein